MREHCAAPAGTLWLNFIVCKNRGADLFLVEPHIGQHAVHKGSLRVWIVFRQLGLYRLLGPQQHDAKQHSSLAFLSGLLAGPWLSMWWSTLMCSVAVKTRGCLFSNIYQFLTVITIPLSCTLRGQTDFQQVRTARMKARRYTAWHVPQSLVIGKGLDMVTMRTWGKIVISEQSVSHSQACRDRASTCKDNGGKVKSHLWIWKRMWHVIHTDLCDNCTEYAKGSEAKVQLINLPFDKRDSEKASSVL